MTEIAEKPKAKKNHQGRVLRLLRTQKNKTQAQVAKDNNMAQSRVFELELMETLPEDILKQFANYYEVSTEFLRTFDLDEATKYFIYNNEAALSDNATMNANQQDNVTINNSDLTKELKEAYEKIAELNKIIGILETEAKFLKKEK